MTMIPTPTEILAETIGGKRTSCRWRDNARGYQARRDSSTGLGAYERSGA